MFCVPITKTHTKRYAKGWKRKESTQKANQKVTAVFLGKKDSSWVFLFLKLPVMLVLQKSRISIRIQTRILGVLQPPHPATVSSVQSLSHVWLFATPWTAARQAYLSITNSRSLLRLMSIKSVMPSSHLILCRPLLLLPPIPPSIRVFSNESTLCMRWPKDWSFSFSISPSS